MKLKTFTKDIFIQNLVRDRRLLAVATAMSFLWGLVYLGFFYTPNYVSQAKIWIKDEMPENYITEPGNPYGELKPLTAGGNPVLTQMEVLRSKSLKRYVSDYMTEQYPNLYKDRNVGASLEENLKLKSEPGTDIVTLKLQWDNPDHAQKILSVLLARYEEMNRSINQRKRSYRREYTERKLAEIQQNLDDVRNRIKNFKESNRAVDINQETQQLVQLRSQLMTQLATASGAMRNAASNSGELRRQLSMSPRQALDAVALGSGNQTLTQLRQDLNATLQEHEYERIRLAPTNPKMLAINSKINSIRAQIQRVAKQSLGRRKGNINLDRVPQIFDPTRSQLVQEMATSRARQMGFGAERGSISGMIGQIDSELAKMPTKKLALDNLEQEERALGTAYDELRKKAIEARIKEAEVTSNIVVFDPPQTPKSASFPEPLHILLMSLLFGLVAGTILSFLRTYIRDFCQGPRHIERATGSQVLGTIPWLPHADSIQRIHPVYNLAYKNILSNLIIHAENRQAKVLTFTSTSIRKARSTNLYNMSRQLRKLGYGVVLMDADLHSPTIYRDVIITGETDADDGLLMPTVGHPVSRPGEDKDPCLEDSASIHAGHVGATMAEGQPVYSGITEQVNLSMLVMALEEKLRHGVVPAETDILSVLSRDDIGLNLLFNDYPIDDPYEFFGCRSFAYIISTLRKHFDWVLINTPAAVIAPEFPLISRLSDGVVLFAAQDATRGSLEKISETLRMVQVPLVGTIIREQDSSLEKEYQDYLNTAGYYEYR